MTEPEKRYAYEASIATDPAEEYETIKTTESPACTLIEKKPVIHQRPETVRQEPGAPVV
jgi:hypothetical protein